jgi:predicted nucleic-acid-binding Zn-ribbon protein
MESTDKPCRNCGSTEWHTREVQARGWAGLGPDLLPLGPFAPAGFEVHVCGNCGLVEWFVPRKYLARLKERFGREA